MYIRATPCRMQLGMILRRHYSRFYGTRSNIDCYTVNSAAFNKNLQEIFQKDNSKSLLSILFFTIVTSELILYREQRLIHDK